MAKKRSHDEIENIDDVNGPMSSTSIHSAVVTLSPVKKGRKAMFFDGMLADDTSQIRLVGFQGMQQRKLNDYYQRNIPVELENCEVKPARGEGYEVMLKSSMLIKQSPKNLDATLLMADNATASKTIILSSLESLDMFQKVTVNIKVMELKDETQVEGKVKQDVYVADESGTARVSVWEGNVNFVKIDQSYCLKNFMVREYQSTKYLTMLKEGSQTIPIEDIGAVAEQGDRDDKLWVINNVTVAGVPYFDTYKSCLQCKARVKPHSDCLGKCSKKDCMMLQRFDLCTQHTTAKLMLLYDKDGVQKTVFAFAYGETVQQISVGDNVSVEGLIEAGTFKSMTLLKDKDIIKEVNK